MTKTIRPPVAKEDAQNTVTVPLSVRLPAGIAIQLYTYAEQMNTSAGKLLGSLLEDVLPVFEQTKEFTVKLRVPQVYRAMVLADLLQGVNLADIEDRLLKRTEPGGPMGRPPKSRARSQSNDPRGKIYNLLRIPVTSTEEVLELSNDSTIE